MTKLASNIDPNEVLALNETAWLLGQPSLEDYLDFVREQTAGGRNAVRSALVDEWRAANDYYYELEQSEAGIADGIEARDLEPALKPLVGKVTNDGRFQRAFDAVPTRFAMVELDRLIVSQSHIDITHCQRQSARIGTSASDADLLRFCQGIDREEAPFTVQKSGHNRYSFTSSSSDFRFHEAKLFTPDQFSGDAAARDNSSILGLMVGYSSNFLSVIASDNRMVLHNGHHRAYTLRALGYTHAPCIVQSVTRRDELNLIACKEVVRNPGHYFLAARPPLLKDFFDLKIRKVFHVPRIMRTVELSFEVREFEVSH